MALSHRAKSLAADLMTLRDLGSRRLFGMEWVRDSHFREFVVTAPDGESFTVAYGDLPAEMEGQLARVGR